MQHPWSLPIGLILTSFGWWECFVNEDDSAFRFVRWMGGVRMRMIEKTRYFTYLIISVWKATLFFLGAWLIVGFNGLLSEGQPLNLFTKFRESFDSHNFNVTEVVDVVIDGDSNTDTGDALELKARAVLYTIKNSPLWVLLIQMGTSYFAYIMAKFASKVQIQGFSFSFPLSAVVPTTATLILASCGARAKDRCFFHDVVPDYLFFECPSVGDFWQYLWNEQVWLWAAWFLSQLWITAHIWFPKSPRLASTEQIFGTPMYCSLAIDQSIVLNRRADGTEDIKNEDLKEQMKLQEMYERYDHFVQDENTSRSGKTGSSSSSGGGGGGLRKQSSSVLPSDRVTKIYGCATMWHETLDEMMEMLKSIFRIDMDFSARHLAQKYLDVVDPDFYEWETHIFFDDAFKINKDTEEQEVNQFVKLLVRVMDDAGTFVHCKKIKVKPPKRIPTPYGGRLEWTLPGKTKIVCHLKVRLHFIFVGSLTLLCFDRTRTRSGTRRDGHSACTCTTCSGSGLWSCPSVMSESRQNTFV